MKKKSKFTNYLVALALILLTITVIIGAKKNNNDINDNKNEANKFLKSNEVNATLSSSYAGYYNALLDSGKKIDGIIFGDDVSSNAIESSLGENLHKTFNDDPVQSWYPTNLSIKGNTICNILPYLLNYQDKSGQAVKSKCYSKPYWIIMTGLNDSKTMDADTFEKFYRMAVRQGINENIDVYCVTEPPSIDTQTGKPVDSNYPEFRNRIEKVAKEEGAIFVDVYSQWLNLSNLKNYTKDGIVPNDDGNSFITDLICKAMLNTKVASSSKKACELSMFPQYDAVSMLNSALIPVTVFTKATTAKDLVTNTNNVFQIDDGGNAVFSLNQGNLTDIIVSVLSNKNAGKITVESNNGNFSPTTLYSTDGDSLSETSYDIKVNNTSGNFFNDVKLSSSLGKAYVTSIYGIYNK